MKYYYLTAQERHLTAQERQYGGRGGGGITSGKWKTFPMLLKGQHPLLWLKEMTETARREQDAWSTGITEGLWHDFRQYNILFYTEIEEELYEQLGETFE